MITRSMQNSQCFARGNFSVNKLTKLFAFLNLTADHVESFSGLNRIPAAAPFSVKMTPLSTSSSLRSAANNANNAAGTTWSEDTTARQKALERCVVPLSASSYKGSSGRIGVLGGSARYTGAPYYAAMASLKCGADLAFCFCAEEATIPLKSYSPELMVAPVYKANEFDNAARRQKQQEFDFIPSEGFDEDIEELVENMVEEVCSMMDKIHVLVLGPGLGRCPLVLEATARIIRKAQSRHNLPLVIDADGLFLLTLPKYRENLLSNDSPVILTPNAMELKRLLDSGYTTKDLPEQCWIIEKGAVDYIRHASSTSETPIMVCREKGGLKRSGGIGDVLAGCCGTLVAWNKILSDREKASSDDLSLACWTACCFVKRSTKRAFGKHRRSMTAPDILEELGPVIDEMTYVS